MLLLFSCQVVFFCVPMDCSRPGSSFHGISQARILEWVAISFSRGSSRPRKLNQTAPTLTGGFFFTREAQHSLLHWHENRCQKTTLGPQIKEEWRRLLFGMKRSRPRKPRIFNLREHQTHLGTLLETHLLQTPQNSGGLPRPQEFAR